MARLRFGRPISLRWNGLLLEGPANTVFEIPDEFYEEFNQDIGPVEPTLVWLDTDEASTLRGRVTALEGAGAGAPLSTATPLALGTAAVGTEAASSHGDHVHPTTGLALSGHNHDASYSSTAHNHSGVYELSGAVSTHESAGDPHPGYLTETAASSTYATSGHNHNGTYEPVNTAILKTIVDAKGDLIVGTAADTVSRLAVGATNGHVLTVDSAEATGLKWAASSGGGGGGGGHSLGTAIPLDLGTAAAGTSTHGSREDHVHSTNGVSLTSHNHTGVYDAAGTAASAVSTHEAAADPHPGYLTPTEGNAAYSATGHAHSGVYDPAGTTSTHAALTTTVHGITDTANLVYTSDSRLTDARTPSSTLAHASTHLSGGTDALSGISPSQVTGTAVVTADSRLSDSRTPTAHKTSHATGGSDALVASDIGAAPTASPTFTGTVTGPFTTAGYVKTTSGGILSSSAAIAQADVTSLTTDLGLKAPLASPTFTGDVTLNAQGDIRFADADSSNWVALQAPSTIAANVSWTLPSADGTAGQVLSTSGAGVLSWATSSGGSQSLTLNQQTGTTYTLAASDINKLVEVSNTGAITVTVPANILAVGDQIHIMQTNTGQITVAAGTNVAAVNSALGLKLRARWSSATLIKRVTSTNADRWVLVGDCEA